MYAMSWERDTRDYKYESIQHGYEVEFDENEQDAIVISLDALLENELEAELELEGEVF
jgi:hypothetical protein